MHDGWFIWIIAFAGRVAESSRAAAAGDQAMCHYPGGTATTAAPSRPTTLGPSCSCSATTSPTTATWRRTRAWARRPGRGATRLEHMVCSRPQNNSFCGHLILPSVPIKPHHPGLPRAARLDLTALSVPATQPQWPAHCN